MTFLKIDRTTVTEQIINYINDQIESGAWPVGSKIKSEPELAEELGVSRSSIRVAVRQFIALGVLESIHGKGTFVCSNPKGITLFEKPVMTDAETANLWDVVEMRVLIEPYAAYCVAQKISPTGLQRLREYYEKMCQTSDNPELFFHYDQRFHETIVEELGNPYVERCLKELFASTFMTHVHIREQLGYKPGLYYHRKILDAIEQKNSQQAYAIMNEHIQMKHDQIPPALKKINAKEGSVHGSEAEEQG